MQIQPRRARGRTRIATRPVDDDDTCSALLVAAFVPRQPSSSSSSRLRPAVDAYFSVVASSLLRQGVGADDGGGVSSSTRRRLHAASSAGALNLGRSRAIVWGQLDDGEDDGEVSFINIYNTCCDAWKSFQDCGTYALAPTTHIHHARN